MSSAAVLFFILAAVNFSFGGAFGVILKDAYSQNREYKLTEDLKDARAEILRLRAQVAKHIGRQ